MSRPIKLAWAQVVEIRAALAAGEAVPSIAARYGLSPRAVHDIRSGRTWGRPAGNRRTHCHRGHAYAEHGYLSRRGAHVCRTCDRANRRPTGDQYRAKHDGHELITNSVGVLRCLTCWRGEDYIDAIAVDRAVAGDPPAYLSVAERAEAIDRLLAAGLSQLAAARRLKVSGRTVQRRAAELRKAAA